MEFTGASTPGIICLCMLPSKHTNTTKRRHEVLTSLLSNFTNRKDKWYWILQFILAYYTGVIAIMYEDFLTDKCGWVNWYPVGKFVKKDLYALELFEKMSEKGSADKMEISHWRDLSSFEITNYIWNPFGCTIIVELLVSTFQGITATFHQYATSGPQIGNELSQFENVEFDHVAKEIENMGVRWISLPTASILILLFEEMTARRLYDLVPISSATEAYLTNENSKNDVRLRNFSRPTNPVLSEEIACYMGLELGWIMIKGFADEEIYVQLHESVRGCDVYLVQLTCPANENVMELLVMSGACRLTLGRRIHEYMLKVG
ncbi:hypothetical protein C1H46_028261 [Malus baccata]|uniref:Ribose-phosphate pyrophosphokinase N-terminal domain-containing protein n=1 Tax=Malus baccata TaxID=106549 RepID=A0A540LI87_MALBA|nr:hypothetical protein C1H46_028261 [Malus baccata]